MKKKLIAATCIVFALVGCATANMEYGRDFSSAQVTQIKKGETTSSQLISLMGEPFNKSLISSNEERWNYFYSTTKSKAQSYIITMDVKTSTHQKTLEVLFKDGVVTNYVFNEGMNTPNIEIKNM
ncbi:TPA: outer membrane protein assembly factor BamE [Aeromonas veronii AMC24]|nr:outer membrane protein assembly factor BamE [Aeromonas veronii AMC24]